MDWLDISHILRASHVCAKWNAVARAQPAFWRDIRLAALSTSALDFFQARLDHPGPRPVSVTLDLEEQPLCGRLRSVVFPAITRNLGRVALLRLLLHQDTASALMEALSRPAPLLKILSLRFYHGRADEPVVLSSDLFANSCELLREVSIYDALLPSTPIPAFKAVDTLFFEFTRPIVFPFELFDHFPELRTLVVIGESCLASEQPDRRAVVPANSSLEGFEIYLARCTYEPVLYSIPNIAAIRSIACKHPYPGIAQLLANHLQGPIEFALFQEFEGLVHITLYAPATDRVRILVEYESHIAEDLPRTILLVPELLARITLLTLHDNLAYLASHLDEMPCCHTLDIVVDKGGRPLPTLDISAPLRLPALKTVLVATDEKVPTTFVSIAADTLHAFLTQLLGTPAKRPSLRLGGVLITGEKEVLYRDFVEEPWPLAVISA
ncbi:hypothetical protein AURDEDRAFT_113699 [Auricularia subglabra TFB-10046 SS5]|nr:hypothetical protein AURDEDRAFT_113699 [Auricularia subglabra TFB-10046 SS5]